MSHRLADKSLGPPGGWRYTQPESGHAFTGVSYRQLLEQVQKHRRGNGYEVSAGWEAGFENDFCEQNNLVGTQWCPCQEVEGKPPRPTGLGDLRRFLRSVKKMLSLGKSIWVDQEEANRRAAICAKCPMNATIPGCFGCNGIKKLVTGIRGSRITNHESGLRQCAVCGCENSIKVWLKEEAVDNQGLEYPPHCWNSALESVRIGCESATLSPAAENHPSDPTA